MPVGYRNRFRHPNKDVMARYVARGVEIYRTDELGALTLKFAADAKGVPVVSAYRNERRRWVVHWNEKRRTPFDVESAFLAQEARGMAFYKFFARNQ